MARTTRGSAAALQAWAEARRRHRLSDAQVQMARELGLNPRKLGALANHRRERWKVRLTEFIEELYRKRLAGRIRSSRSATGATATVWRPWSGGATTSTMTVGSSSETMRFSAWRSSSAVSSTCWRVSPRGPSGRRPRWYGDVSPVMEWAIVAGLIHQCGGSCSARPEAARWELTRWQPSGVRRAGGDGRDRRRRQRSFLGPDRRCCHPRTRRRTIGADDVLGRLCEVEEELLFLDRAAA